MSDLVEKLSQRRARVGVVGLGYVGLPLAASFADAGYDVIGFEVDESKVSDIMAGRSYILDVEAEDVDRIVRAGKLEATTNFARLAECDTISVCVPTPLRKTRDPDLTYIVRATAEISRYLRAGQLIVLESTTYPGTTVEVVAPKLEETGLKVGKDFFLAFTQSESTRAMSPLQ